MPRREAVDKALDVIRKSAANYEYFFNRLDTPDWIKPLSEAGLFRDPPEPIVEDQYIRFPIWPESKYLARMAALAPGEVIEVALQIPDTENPRVHEDFADIALAVPAGLAAELVQKEIKWIKSQEQIYLSLPTKLGALVKHLAQGRETDTALELMHAILTVKPTGRAVGAPEVRALFDLWHYREIISDHVPTLVSKAGFAVFTMLCDLLNEAMRLSQTNSEDTTPYDTSLIWRPSISRHPENAPNDLRDVLVTATRDAGKQLVAAKQTTLGNIVSNLNTRPWPVFHRIALHLLRVFSEEVPGLVAQVLTNRETFNHMETLYEYALLLQEQFAKLGSKDQAIIFNWILEGPDLEVYRARETRMGRPVTDEEVERYARAWRWRRLGLIGDTVGLPNALEHHYRELIEEFGRPDPPRPPFAITGFLRGPSSPKMAEELRGLSIDELIEELEEFLISWKREKHVDRWKPSPEGLSRELSKLVATDPKRFADSATSLKGLDPTYVRAVFSGLRTAVEQKRPISWPAVLDLAHWVVEQPRELEGCDEAYVHLDVDIGWAETRKALARLLEGGLSPGRAEIPFDQRARVWEVLEPLIHDPDPTPELERTSDSSVMDPATVSVNTVRGQAMHTVVHYALWVRRHYEAASNETALEHGFDEMPEVRRVLEDHLDLGIETSVAVRAVYGWYFPYLVLLDPDWAIGNVATIFPQNEALLHLRNAAWEAYILFSQPYSSILDVLRQEYDRAVDLIGSVSSRRLPHNIDQRLAQHLMVFYGYGDLTMAEDDLIAKFFNQAPESLRMYALEFAGGILRRDGELEPEVLDRFRKLWNWRTETAIDAPQELAAFGWWFASGVFDDEWSFNQLERVLRLAGRLEASELVLERLAVLTLGMPLRAVGCLALIIENAKDDWFIGAWENHIRGILSSALQSGEKVAKQVATDLAHQLGARGYWQFRDLLSSK